VVRRTSDIALLLGSRGRAKTRGGFGRSFRQLLDGWFGRSPWREERPSRRVVPGWLALGAVLGSFAGGFWLGGKATPRDGVAATLDAKVGKEAGFIDADEMPCNRQFLMAAAYIGLSSTQAHGSAKALAEYLRGKGLQKAKPYLFATAKGPVWVVAVYYEGKTEEQKTTQLMRALPADVPDEAFLSLRRHQEASENGWPQSYPVPNS
jgi:hypothetical protein